MPTVAQSGEKGLAVAGRILLGLALAIGVALALVFAFAAAVAAGLMILGALIALHVPPRRAAVGPETLDATRTPEGWVVETRTRRPS